MGRTAQSGGVKFCWQIWPDTAAWAILPRFVSRRGETAVRNPGKMAFSYLQAAHGPDAFSLARQLGLEFSDLERQILARQVDYRLELAVDEQCRPAFRCRGRSS